MNQPLYLTPVALELEKSASEVSLPEDANQWPTEIMQELYKQVPYIADFDPQVVMDRVDAERGYGFGHIEVQNKSEAQNSASSGDKKSIGIQQVRVPVIIKERRLQPLDVLVTTGSKALPLTENRLRQALFRPQAFDVTGKTPGDMSMVGQLYPPHRQLGGGGTGGVTKDASAKACPDCGKMKCKCADAGMPDEGEHFDFKEAAGDMPTQDQFHAKLEKVLGLSPAEMAQLKAQHAPQKTAAPNLPGVPAISMGTRVKDLVPKMKLGSIIGAILPTISVADYIEFTEPFNDTGLQRAFMKNAGAADVARMLLEFEPDATDKTAAMLDAFVPSVVQVVKAGEGYVVKMASHLAWNPTTELVDRGFIVRELGEKVALAADTDGAVTMTDDEGAKASPEEHREELVAGFGYYTVQSTDGSPLTGFVFPNLYDTDGTAMPIALFADGAHATVQEAIVGERVTEGVPEVPITGGEPQGHGCFVRQLEGSYEATIPFTIKGGYASGGAQQYQAETYDGRQKMLSVQDGGGLKIPQEIDDTCIIPADYQWMSLGEADDIELVSNPEEWGQKKEAQRALASVVVRAGGDNDFWLEGSVLNKVAAKSLTLDEAMFVLGGLGTDLAYGAEKLAEAIYRAAPVQVKVARALTPYNYAAERAKLAEAGPVRFRVSLVKEAAFIPDPSAVDTVLSLGFINPENMHTFVSYLPQIEQSLSRLCELLIASRLGLTDVPSGPLEKCIRSMDEAIDGLKILAFMKG